MQYMQDEVHWRELRPSFVLLTRWNNWTLCISTNTIDYDSNWALYVVKRCTMWWWPFCKYSSLVGLAEEFGDG